MRIVVIGLGYLGATHAACMAELGHEVLGIEIDNYRRSAISEGNLPFYEPQLDLILRRNLDNGRLRVSASYEDAAQFGEVFFIAVGTPQRKGDYAADLKYVDSVIEELVPLLQGDCVILGKSMVPVGTATRLRARTAELCRPGTVIDVGWNPEFLREGHAVEDTLSPDRIVVGVETKGGAAEKVGREVYAQILEKDTPLLVMDLASAELVKVAANSFLATKISFINAIAEVCDAAGADISAVADGIGYDDRIGRKFLNAGLGFGGGCLPKDIRAFMARAGELGAAEALAFLREVDSINLRRRNRIVELARVVCGGALIGSTVAVLGAAFKPNSDDVRDSPALNVAGQIQLQGAAVSVYDPQAMSNSRMVFPTLDYVDTAMEACANSDVVLVLTEWDEFRDLDPVIVGQVVRERRIIDGRLCLDAARWQGAGWAYSR